MSNTERTTTVAQGKALTIQALSQTAAGTAKSLTTPPPSIRQNTRIDIDDGPLLDDNKLEDETI